MKHIKTKLGILLLCVMFIFAIPVMAQDVTEKKEIGTPVERVEHSITGENVSIATNELNKLKDFNDFTEKVRFSSDSYYLTEVLPKANDVITKGQKLYIKFYARDTWKYYYTKPIISVFNSNSDIVYSNFSQETVSVSGQDSYSGYISWNTSKAASGKYYVYIVNAPCYKNGTLVSDWATFDCPYIKTKFTLKEATHKHTYGAWKTVKSATVFENGKKECSCKSCGKKKSQSIPKLKPTIKLSATNKAIGKNKSYILKITNLAKGDAVKSVKSNNTTVATVKKVKTNQYKITGTKKGTATITVVLKSGKKAICKIAVK